MLMLHDVHMRECISLRRMYDVPNAILQLRAERMASVPQEPLDGIEVRFRTTGGCFSRRFHVDQDIKVSVFFKFRQH